MHWKPIETNMAIQLLPPIPDGGGFSPSFADSGYYRYYQIWPIAYGMAASALRYPRLGPAAMRPTAL